MYHRQIQRRASVWERLDRAHALRHARPQSAEPRQLPRPDLPEGTELLPHIVVLMMENHSYDNYLGMLTGRGDGFPLDHDGQPQVSNPDADGRPVAAFRMPGAAQQEKVPSQSWHATHLQWDDGKLDGFVAGNLAVFPDRDASASMGYWTEDDLPFYYGLARTFPLADRWFSSCLGPTFPNRRFLMAGTADGLIDDSPFNLLDYPATGTIFDLLTRNGISWVNYHPVARDQSRFWRYARYRQRMARRRIHASLHGVRGVPGDVHKDMQFTADIFPVGIARYMEHIRGVDDFFAAADAGTLPAFSIVDPDFTSYSEENPQDISKGESFAAEVIRRVTHGKGWERTLLIWLYDEHGGYYDHVPPPPAVAPDDVEARSVLMQPTLLNRILRAVRPSMVRTAEKLDRGPKTYDRLGFRVPAVIVSPYARRDCVLSEVLDHTSVLKLVEEKWNLPPLTRRDAAAVSPLAALDLDSPAAFLEPPSLPEPRLKWGTW
jgi:phospholipase C